MMTWSDGWRLPGPDRGRTPGYLLQPAAQLVIQAVLRACPRLLSIQAEILVSSHPFKGAGRGATRPDRSDRGRICVIVWNVRVAAARSQQRDRQDARLWSAGVAAVATVATYTPVEGRGSGSVLFPAAAAKTAS